MNVRNVKNLPGTLAFSTAKENTRKLRNAAGRLLRLAASNLSAGTLYLQLHDTKAALAGTEVPMFTVPIGALGFACLEDFTFTVGITCALSTTADTYTAPGAADGWFYAETL